MTANGPRPGNAPIRSSGDRSSRPAPSGPPADAAPAPASARQSRLLEYSGPGRRVAWLDLWLFAPLALPFFAEVYVAILLTLHQALGLGGGLPGFAPFHWIFINATGVLAVLWALARLRLPLRDLVLADAYGRVCVAALLVYWIWRGASPVFALFILTELGGALYAVWPRRAARA